MVATREGQQTCPSTASLLQQQPWDLVGGSMVLVMLMVVGIVIGVLITLLFVRRRAKSNDSSSLSLSSYSSSLAMEHAHDCRQRLPDTIILIRHGESQANADPSCWIEMPDNLLGLTRRGHEQAAAAGRRVEEILWQQLTLDNNNNNNAGLTTTTTRVHLIVSPFERSMQTAASLRPAFEHRIVRTDIESRIREQEMGNLQSNPTLFQQYRQEQQRVGRFWYRFPTGESGSDVLDRVKSWWYESIQTVNTRVGYEPVQAIVVVSHGACDACVVCRARFSCLLYFLSYWFVRLWFS